MARINLNAEVFQDVRFKKLAYTLQIDIFSAIGRMAALWAYCTHRETYSVAEEDINLIMEHEEAAAALKVCQLAGKRNGSNKLYIRGTKGRIEWISSLRKNSRKGGKATKAKWQAKRPSPGQPDEGASSPALVSSPALINTKKKEEVCSEAAKFDSPEPVPGIDCSEIPQAGFETIPQEFQDPVILEFFKRGKIKPSTVFLWIKTYENVQWLRQEFFKAIQYLKDNPAKSPKKNYASFMGRWFSRGWEWHRRSTPGKALGGVKVSQTPDFLD